MVRKTDMMSEDPKAEEAPASVEGEGDEATADAQDDPQEATEGSTEADVPPGGSGPGEFPFGDQEGDEGSQEGLDPEGSLPSELEALQNEYERLKDQHLRLAADFENYRKRATGDLASGWVRAQAELVRTLVEGLDDLQRVSQFTSEDTTVDTIIEGVDLVERKILKALTDAGLEVLNPDGEPFDPNIMEAMMRVPTEEDDQDDTVHQVFDKGYMFKNQLVRPARVSVYKDDD
ncbi:nucleotide exchange factor GrpE [Gemmatimonadota bacterium]